MQQPAPTEAFALQARVAAALGDAAGWVLQMLLTDDDQDADVAADSALVGEALALRTLRRARAGQALVGDGQVAEAATRLWAVLRVSAARAGGGLDALTLLGEPERGKAGRVAWTRPSLLYRLLLASGLRFDGEGQSPLAACAEGPAPPDASPEYKARVALRDAVADGSYTSFVAALDMAVCSPDELALLCAWTVLVLMRPF